MKRFLITLAVLAVVLGGVYLWWQMKATEIITAQVHSMARGMFVNGDALQVENKPVKMLGLRQARVPQLVITGKDLELRNGGKIASAKLVLQDLDVSGPPFHFSGVGSGYCMVTATDKDVTAYMQKRDIGLPGGKLNILFVGFSKQNGALLKGEGVVKLPFVKEQHFPITATGNLVPSSKVGQVDFRVHDVKVDKLSIGVKQVTDAIGIVNPVIDISDWPLITDIKQVNTGNGTIQFKAQITGVRPSLLP